MKTQSWIPVCWIWNIHWKCPKCLVFTPLHYCLIHGACSYWCRIYTLSRLCLSCLLWHSLPVFPSCVLSASLDCFMLSFMLLALTSRWSQLCHVFMPEVLQNTFQVSVKERANGHSRLHKTRPLERVPENISWAPRSQVKALGNTGTT